jgi:hypothetical protein
VLSWTGTTSRKVNFYYCWRRWTSGIFSVLRVCLSSGKSSKLCPRRNDLMYGNTAKSICAKSGLYGGCFRHSNPSKYNSSWLLLLLTSLNVRNFFCAPGVSFYWFLNWRKYDYLSMYCDKIVYNNNKHNMCVVLHLHMWIYQDDYHIKKILLNLSNTTTSLQ